MSIVSWVETHISAAHVPQGGGPMHGHTWRVRATWPYQGENAPDLKAALIEACREFDHGILPSHLTRAESLAKYLGEALRAIRIDIWREPEGMGATWSA